MLQFHKHLLTFGALCGVAGLSYVLPFVAVVSVVIGVCTYVYVNNVNILVLNPTSSLKARFSVFRSWLEYIQMKGYQLSKPAEEKVRIKNTGYSKENSPHISISHRLSFPRSRYTCSDDSNNSANRRNGFSRYSLSQVNSSFDSSSRLENQYDNRSKSQDSNSSFRDEKNNLSRLSPWSDSENSLRDSNRRIKTVQTLAGPLLSSTKLNRSNSFDLGLYVDAGSPGLATRVVQYAEDSGFVGNKVTHQSQYSGPGQFPRVHLNRSHSKLPVLSPRNSQKVARRSINVRIVSPEQHGFGSRLFSHGSRSSNLHSSPPPAHMDPSTKSLLETLREISRKRMHSQLDEDDDDDAKRQKKSELESSSTSSSLPNGAIIDNDLQSKRSREDSPKQVDNQTQRPSKRSRNNEILSSLSSSRKLLQAGGIKRKTHSLDWSRSSTPVFGKQFKTSELSPPAVSVAGNNNNVSPTTVAVVKGISPNVTSEIETPKLPTHPKSNIFMSAEKPSVVQMGRKGSPEVTVPAKQMSISQPSKLKDTLEEENCISEKSACVLDDLRSLKDRYPVGNQNKLVGMLSSLSDGEKAPVTRATVEPAKSVDILSTTSSPAACLSTATCTTSVLPTISSSSAEATKLMTSGVSVSSPMQSFSGFGSGSNTSITNNFSSSQPIPSVSLSEGITGGSNPVAVASSQASVDNSKSQLTNSQSPFNSVSVPNSTTSVQFGFGSTASTSTTVAAASQDTPQTTTTGANFGFIPTSLQQTKETDANTPPSSTPSTFGFSGNTSTNKPSTPSASGFGVANSVNFGSTSGGFNIASPTVTAQSTSSSAAASLFSVQQPTSTSSAENSSVVKGPSMFASPTSAQQSQGTTITTSSFVPVSAVQNTLGTGGALFGPSSTSSQINKSFGFGNGSVTSPSVQQTGTGSSIFGSTVTSTPVQQTNTSTVSNVQNSAFGSAPSSQPPKQGGFSFGNPSASSATSTGQAEGKPGGFAFGASAFNTTGTSQDQPKTFGFGPLSTPATVSFGTQQTPTTISFGTQQTPATISFGTPQTPVSSSFGTPQTAANSSFGTPQTAANSSFGTPQTPAGGSFRTQQTPASGSFRTQQTQASNSFGTQQTPVSSSFGTQQTPASSSFGTQQTPGSSSASLFGAQGDNSSAMGGFSFLSKQNSATPNNGSGTTSAFQLGQANATTTNQNPAGGFKFGFGNSSKPVSTTSSSASSGFGSMFSPSSANSVAPTASQQVQFGSSAPADKPMFSFGSSNKQSSFGTVGAPATNAPQSSAGGFGNPFGSPATSAPSAAESHQKSQGMFSFGSGPGFGAGNTSTNAFSFGSSTEKKEGGFAFGSTSQQPANSGGTFNFNTGSSVPAPATHNFSNRGMFGAQQPQPTSAFSFGAGSSGSTGSGGFSFGAQNSSTFGTGPSSGVQNTSTPAFGGGLSTGASSGSAPGFGAGPSGSNPFQMANNSSGFGGAPMFSIGSGSTAPRATRSSGTRNRRTK